METAGEGDGAPPEKINGFETWRSQKLRRSEGVSEAIAEREPAAEIPSSARDLF
jgi:hypothetical protein